MILTRIQLYYLTQKVGITNLRGYFNIYIYIFILTIHVCIYEFSDFELKLINKMKLEKPLTLAEKYEEKKNLKNVLYYSDEHYFCPSDEFPKLLPVKK